LLVLDACSDRSTAPTERRPAASADLITDALAAVVGQWSPVFPAPIVQLHLHLLPNGKVLSWGHAGDPQVWDPADTGAVHAAELWNPATGLWTTLASNAVTRIYHSTTLLLPDGRVLHTGSGDAGGAADERSYEIFSPPYLFKGPRPSITSASPGVVAYGQSILVETPDAASVAKVTLIRLGSVTHAFDQAQRLVPLSFTRELGGVSVQIPASRTVATPGPYLVFLVTIWYSS